MQLPPPLALPKPPTRRRAPPAVPQTDAATLADQRRRLRREKAQLTKERAELAQKAREATSQLRVAKAACKARELHLSASAATKALGDARGAALGRPSSDAVALELKTLQRELAEGTKHALACERRAAVTKERLEVAREKLAALPSCDVDREDELARRERDADATRLRFERERLDRCASAVRDLAELEHALRRARADRSDVVAQLDDAAEATSRWKRQVGAAAARARPLRARVQALKEELRDFANGVGEAPRDAAEALFDVAGEPELEVEKADALLDLAWVDLAPLPAFDGPDPAPDGDDGDEMAFLREFGPPAVAREAAGRGAAARRFGERGAVDREGFVLLFEEALAFGAIRPDAAVPEAAAVASPEPSPERRAASPAASRVPPIVLAPAPAPRAEAPRSPDYDAVVPRSPDDDAEAPRSPDDEDDNPRSPDYEDDYDAFEDEDFDAEEA